MNIPSGSGNAAGAVCEFQLTLLFRTLEPNTIVHSLNSSLMKKTSILGTKPCHERHGPLDAFTLCLTLLGLLHIWGFAHQDF